MAYHFHHLAALLLLLTAHVTAEIDYSDPLIGKALEHYVTENMPEGVVSRFQCSHKGARCVFRRPSYASELIDFTTGQQTQNTQGAVWSPLENLDTTTLKLGACTASDSNDCIVTCNANCTCQYSTDNFATDSQPCTEIASRAPTEAPVVETVDRVCPKAQFTEFCPELMQNLPLGNDQKYDCFNFCGGIWTSACDYKDGVDGCDQAATRNVCENKTAAGTKFGQVYGCTAATTDNGDGGNTNGGPNNNSNGNNSQSMSDKRVKVALALVVATLLIAF